jgi:hypothetical protein
VEDIEHRTTKVRSPRTDGFVERTNRTLLDECFRVQGWQTWYIAVDEIQRNLDRFLRYYNLERSHQGSRLKGRTPAQALMEALAVTEIPDILPAEEVNEPLPRAAQRLARRSGPSGKYSDLYNDVMAAPLIDRMLPRCHLVNIRGNSYRMREHTALLQALLQSDGSRARHHRQTISQIEGQIALRHDMCAILVRQICVALTRR